MKVSYEYSWLIKELKEELADGMLTKDSTVKIVRDRRLLGGDPGMHG